MQTLIFILEWNVCYACRIQIQRLQILLLFKRGRSFGLFPQASQSRKKQLENYTISGGGTGLHRDELDEDISVKSLLLGIGDRTQYAARRHKKVS